MINQNPTKGNSTTWAIVITVAVVLAGLFMIPRLNRSGGGGSTAGGAPCLVAGLPMAQHIHSHLRILVDGKEETIPANVGINSCEHALHTHDATGEIHVEAQDLHAYTLGEFFATWGKPLAREGYEMTMTVGGAPSTELGALQLKDKQEIMVQYKHTGNANNANGK